MSTVMHRLIARLSSGFVLAFHDILPQRLSELVDSMQPAQAIPLAELVDRSKRGACTSGLFAITVDDGVGETVKSLSQLFQARGWPGTFYLSTDYIESGQGMGFQLWREILPLLPLRKPELKSGAIDLSTPGAVQKLSKKMERSWHSQRPEAYLPLTLELADIALRENELTAEAIRPPEPITWPEVAELSRNELIRFESHGVSHAAMSALTSEELIFEMKHSRDLVSLHTGRACRHLAYPFGSELSIGARTSAIARQYYDSAVTMTLGHVDSANLWLLPRIPLYPKTSPWLANAKILLKCSGRRFGGVPRRGNAGQLPVESGPASAAGRSAI